MATVEAAEEQTLLFSLRFKLIGFRRRGAEAGFPSCLATLTLLFPEKIQTGLVRVRYHYSVIEFNELWLGGGSTFLRSALSHTQHKPTDANVASQTQSITRRGPPEMALYTRWGQSFSEPVHYTPGAVRVSSDVYARVASLLLSIVATIYHMIYSSMEPLVDRRRYILLILT